MSTVNYKPLDFALLLIRIVAGATLFYFGAQKLLGVWGGMGYMETLKVFEKNSGYHPALSTCAIFAEFFGSLGLIFGFLSRIAGAGVAVTMAVASTVHAPATDFYVPATIKDLAFPILICTIALAIVITGPGQIALDSIFKKRPKKGAA